VHMTQLRLPSHESINGCRASYGHHQSNRSTISMNDVDSFWAPNLSLLRSRFPVVAEAVVEWSGPDADTTKCQQTGEGPTLVERGMVLDHPDKPRSAAAQWVSRIVRDERFVKAERVWVFGFASGYHVESLQDQISGKVSVVEPSVDVMVAALKSRDLTQILGRLEGLYVGAVPDEVSPGVELTIRSFTQSLYPDFCEQLRRAVNTAKGSAQLKPAIGVVGPLQGGTLPIYHYVTRTLAERKHRVRGLDMSPMASGYHQISVILRDKFRRSLAENTFVDYLSQLTLENVNERAIDIFLCMAQAPITMRALQELKSRGVVTVLWFLEDYQRFTYWKPLAPAFDFIFTIQRGECLQQMRQAGAGEVHYLPPACDPSVHRPLALSPEERARWGGPLSFVGAGYHNRQQVFASLSHLPLRLWGTEWPEMKPFSFLVQEKGRRIAPEEYVKIFCSTDINLNLHSSNERDGVDPFGDFVNPRTFELASSGAFQLVDHRQLLPELFVPGEEVITFRSTDELKHLIHFYSNQPELRHEIAMRARARALKDHTYEKRLSQMLDVIYASKYDTLASRQAASPWMRVLERVKGVPELEKRFRVSYERGDEPVLDGLVYDVGAGKGKLNDVEQKILFLHHIRRQMIVNRPDDTVA
jgi:spore maturation protein CgeB